MIKLYEPEVIRAINGMGWTVVRYGRDEEGPFQEWIGKNYKNFEEAQEFAISWKIQTLQSQINYSDSIARGN